MNKKQVLLSVTGGFIFLSLLFSCEKNKDSDILLFVEPDKNYLEIEKQEKIDFSITCESSNEIKNFKIGAKTSEFAINYFFDSTINKNNFNLSYSYKIPEDYNQDDITLVFSVEDINNQEKKLAKKIIITKADTLLKETTGHTIYSHLSEEADAYNLLENEPVYTNYGDSSDIHIYDASEDSLHGNNLSRRWETMTNTNFVNYNDFDYANATNISIKEAYESGVKKEFVSNIKTDNIIIANINDTSLVAIKITGVFDPDSTQNDRYLFNLKK